MTLPPHRRTDRGFSMPERSTRKPGQGALGGAAVAGLLALAVAGPAAAESAPSADLAVNLTRLLVKQGVISQAAADELLAEAERQTASAQAASAQATAPSLPPPAPGTTRISYVPETVKAQLRDEIRREVIQQAKAENWAQPNVIPEWTRRITLSGDVRFRDQFDQYDEGNVPILVNFAALNARGPTDLNPNTNPAGVPLLNTLQDRGSQMSVRARLKLRAEISDTITATMRLASGRNNGPISTTQLLGGGLTKKDIWLDQAFIDVKPTSWISGSLGRMPNPFVAEVEGHKLSELVYDEDLALDGVAASVRYDLFPRRGISVSGTAGAFLMDYRDGDFPDTSVNKASTKTKWMFGGQGAVDWKTQRFDWRTSLGFYQFQYDRGLLSEPCALYTGLTECSTDFTRPAFMQKGNTLFLIRNILPPPGVTDYPVPQYAGLSFDYDVLDLTSSVDLKLANQRHLLLVGAYARNLAFDRGDACRYNELGLPVNNNIDANPCPAPAAGQAGSRLGTGPNAYMGKVFYGHLNPYRWGEWSLSGGYKRIEADAILDGYTDSDFHLGGTNAKGYFLNASMGLFNGANLEFRWFSANEVAGPPLSIDVGQIDLNVRF
jgi:hypothetical protein